MQKESSKSINKPKPKKKKGKQKYIYEPIVSLNGQITQKIYIKLGFLGKGGFSSCYVTQCVGSEKLLATKVIRKSDLKSNRTKIRLMNQIKIHQTFNHPNIVQFIHYFEDLDNVYLMLELCENQSLNQWLKVRETLTTPEIQSLVYGICCGLKYLHAKKYIHRDLKLANIFLDEDFHVKIGDFGLTSQLQFLKENKRTVCGTPNYIAPEILEGTGYHFTVDIWSIGIIIYSLFYGFPPFQAEESQQIYSKIKNNYYTFPKNNEVPPEALSLIKRILVLEPSKRLTLDQIIESPFMRLGKGIPLSLPDICGERVPAKKDFAGIKFLSVQRATKQTSREQQKKGFNSFQNKENDFPFYKNHPEEGNKQAAQKIKNMFSDLGSEAFITQIEQIDENTYYFCTNQYVLGVYQRYMRVCWVNIRDLRNKIVLMEEIVFSHNLFTQKTKIDFQNYKYKHILTYKSKDLLEKDQLFKIKQKSNIYVSKVHRYKDMLMIRLSNKSIQILFEGKDGFIYESKRNRLFYYGKLWEIEKNLKGIDVEIIDLLASEGKKGDITIKCLGGKTINASFHKIKCINDIIQEYQQKKTRHNRMRNSQ